LFEPEQVSAVHGHHFIDAVAKNEAAVHDADFGVGQQGECAVEIARECRKVSHYGIIVLGQESGPGFLRIIEGFAAGAACNLRVI
jgi:hypothetical protein